MILAFMEQLTQILDMRIEAIRDELDVLEKLHEELHPPGCTCLTRLKESLMQIGPK